MRAFITVGATSPFDQLIETVHSHEVLRALSKKGFNYIVIQSGPSKRYLDSHTERNDVVIDIWKLKPSLKDDFHAADLIISHAGSGSVLEALRLHKPLIVIPNPTLLDNHQLELAEALEKRGHLKSSTISNLASTIIEFDSSTLVPFPGFDDTRFRAILDEEMGFGS